MSTKTKGITGAVVSPDTPLLTLIVVLLYSAPPQYTPPFRSFDPKP